MDERAKHICDELWKNYEIFVRSIVRKRMPDRPRDSEDVVANVATALCELYASGKTLEHPSSWLLKTTLNYIKRNFDTVARDANITAKETLNTIQLSYNVDFEDLLVTEEHIELLKDKILKMLKPSDLELYHYVYEEDLSYREISKIMDSSESAVKQKAYRLNEKLSIYIRDALDNSN